MGLIQFLVERPDLLASSLESEHVDFVMYDGRIAASTVEKDGDLFVCRRDASESGQMRLMWPRFDGVHNVIHSTTLREQQEPYQLEIELARGQLSRLRNQFSVWNGSGLQSSEKLNDLIREAHRAFRSAALRAEFPEISAAAAVLSIELSAQACDLLCEHYISQRIEYRRQRAARIPVFLGGSLATPPKNEERFLSIFNAVQVLTKWSEIEPEDGDYQWDTLDSVVEWAQRNSLRMLGGPLLDLWNPDLPEWMNSWTGSLRNLSSFAADYVETVISRYVGRIRHWEVVAGGNCGGLGGLNEEERLNLLSSVISAARGVDEQIQVSLRVIQPWGEYLSRSQNRLSPTQFFDTLRRCGVRFDEINLDLRIQSGSRPSLRRDLLSLSQLIDIWSGFQLPINVLISSPQVTELQNEIQNAQWLRDAVTMCLSKERVSGIWISGWEENQNDSPGGLFTADGTASESLEGLDMISRVYLN